MKTESSTETSSIESSTAETSSIETVDRAALARKARFGTLPARIPVESMIVEQPAHPRNPAGDEYYAANCWRDAACVALDGF